MLIKHLLYFTIFVLILLFVPFNYGFCSTSSYIFDFSPYIFNTGTLSNQNDWVNQYTETSKISVIDTDSFSGTQSIYLDPAYNHNYQYDFDATSTDYSGIYYWSASFKLDATSTTGFEVSWQGNNHNLVKLYSGYPIMQAGRFSGSSYIEIAVMPIPDFALDTWYQVVIRIDFDNLVATYFCREKGGEWEEITPDDSYTYWIYSSKNALTTSYLEIVSVAPVEAYVDDIAFSVNDPRDDYSFDYTYGDFGSATTSRVSAFEVLSREHTDNVFDFRVLIGGTNPEAYENLDFSIYTSTSTLVATSTYDLVSWDSFLDIPMDIFKFDYRGLSYPEDIYQFDFVFRMDSGATSSIQTLYLDLDTLDPVMEDQTWIDNFAGLGGEEYNFWDQWGISVALKGYLEDIQLKFPFSWLISAKALWDDKIDELESAESIDPLQVSITLATTTEYLGGMEIQLFDLKGANEQYGDEIAVFRTLLGVSVWLLTFFVIIGKIRRFLTDLGD